MERVYGRKQYMGEEGRFRKCKKSVGRIWREDEYRSKKTRKLDMVEEKDFKKRELPRKFMAKMLYR